MNWLDALSCDSCGDTTKSKELKRFDGQLLCRVCLSISKATLQGPCVECGLIHSSKEC